ncbi:hypothetical protein OSB04_022949 [Centaurea solstitialis]|uniref:Peptidase M1 alanyl aminopeptidase C-terminal domain-containing protein n=1 Tax=Centaurea solstitialis TaxID=347529 RepID=A0AA38W1U1_9ASTR|nr:hypothetical protein OSB04_022949 [Centaurea solstitialis]
MDNRGARLNRHPRRNADRGNEDYRRDPRDIEEIARLQQRVRDLELQRGFQSDEDTETDSIVWDEGDDPRNPFDQGDQWNPFARREPQTDPLRNLGVKIDVVVDHVNDIELPQYDEAEYAENDVSPVLIWQKICLRPLTQNSNSMATVQGKNCHFIVDSYSRKQHASELKQEFIDPVIENRSSEKYAFNHVNTASWHLKNTSLSYFGSLSDQEVIELVLHDYTATNMKDQLSALAAIALKPVKACHDVLADLYGNASRQESKVKASRIRMIRGNFNKVVWDKNIHFSKWKRHILKILLKVKKTRGRVFFKRGSMMQVRLTKQNRGKLALQDYR